MRVCGGGALAAFSLQAASSPFCPSVRAWMPSAGRVCVPFDRVRVLAVLLHCHRSPGARGLPFLQRFSPLFGSLTRAFASLSAIGLPENRSRQRVSLLRLFLVVCPHGLLCLGTLTTKSSEVTTFQPVRPFE